MRKETTLHNVHVLLLFHPVLSSLVLHVHSQLFLSPHFALSKFMTRTLRHESSILREKDGAIKIDDLVEKMKGQIVSTLRWTDKIWVNSLAERGG